MRLLLQAIGNLLTMFRQQFHIGFFLKLKKLYFLSEQINFLILKIIYRDIKKIKILKVQIITENCL